MTFGDCDVLGRPCVGPNAHRPRNDTSGPFDATPAPVLLADGSHIVGASMLGAGPTYAAAVAGNTLYVWGNCAMNLTKFKSCVEGAAPGVAAPMPGIEGTITSLSLGHDGFLVAGGDVYRFGPGTGGVVWKHPALPGLPTFTQVSASQGLLLALDTGTPLWAATVCSDRPLTFVSCCVSFLVVVAGCACTQTGMFTCVIQGALRVAVC